MKKLTSKNNKSVNSIGVIFLHGNSCDNSFFDKQFSNSELNNYQLISINLPGHGNSLKDSNAYTLSEIRTSISYTINSFDLEKVILVGHSMGGHLSIQSLSDIKNVVGICLIGVPLLAFPPAIDQAFLPNPIIPLLFTDELTNENIESIARNYTTTNNVSNIVNAIKNTDKNFRKILGQDIALGNSIDEIIAIRNSNIKCCMIQGENDPISNLEYINNIKDLSLWKNEVHIISKSGHSPQIENAEKVNELLNLYINDMCK